jgi:hypothetical protein
MIPINFMIQSFLLLKKTGGRGKAVGLDSPFKKNDLCLEHHAGVV